MRRRSILFVLLAAGCGNFETPSIVLDLRTLGAIAEPPEVVAPFDGPTGARICLLGRVACSDKDPCPAHGRWKSVSNEVSTFFRDTKVSDLLESPVARVTRKPSAAR